VLFVVFVLAWVFRNSLWRDTEEKTTS
jgi:hypothetical protein